MEEKASQQIQSNPLIETVKQLLRDHEMNYGSREQSIPVKLGDRQYNVMVAHAVQSFINSHVTNSQTNVLNTDKGVSVKIRNAAFIHVREQLGAPVEKREKAAPKPKHVRIYSDDDEPDSDYRVNIRGMNGRNSDDDYSPRSRR